MIEAALAGAIAGYAIAIPVGAIAVLIIQTGIRHGLRQALAAGAGTATADLAYAAVAVLVGLAVAQLIEPIQTPLRIIAGVVLIGLGLLGLARLRTPAIEATEPADAVITNRSWRQTYVLFLGLTLLNPATIAYFASLVVGLPSLAGVPERLAFVVAVFGASLSWQSLLAYVGALLGRRAGQRLRVPTILLGNAVVILLGALILIEGLTAT